MRCKALTPPSAPFCWLHVLCLCAACTPLGGPGAAAAPYSRRTANCSSCCCSSMSNRSSMSRGKAAGLGLHCLANAAAAVIPFDALLLLQTKTLLQALQPSPASMSLSESSCGVPETGKGVEFVVYSSNTFSNSITPAATAAAHQGQQKQQPQQHPCQGAWENLQPFLLFPLIEKDDFQHTTCEPNSRCFCGCCCCSFGC